VIRVKLLGSDVSGLKGRLGELPVSFAVSRQLTQFGVPSSSLYDNA
jgi:hypothetical protein